VRDNTRSSEFNKSGSSSSKTRSAVDDDSDTPENIAACVCHTDELGIPLCPLSALLAHGVAHGCIKRAACVQSLQKVRKWRSLVASCVRNHLHHGILQSSRHLHQYKLHDNITGV
jgi:hypothetical protein